MARAAIDVPERIGGAHVVLRPLREDDVGAYLAAFAADPSLGRLIGAEHDPGEEEVRAKVAQPSGVHDDDHWARLAIADRASDAFRGALTVHALRPEHGRCEIGFWLIPTARGHGMATAAVSLALTWLFDTRRLARVELTTTPDNDAALALARRLGFRAEGTLRSRDLERGRRVDIVCFGLLRDEWVGAGAADRALRDPGD